MLLEQAILPVRNIVSEVLGVGLKSKKVCYMFRVLPSGVGVYAVISPGS
jgi:hypothetical protein